MTATGSPASEEDPVRLTAWVHGRVQGVGFRWWTRARALELGLVGWAANLSDGRVEVVAEGRRERCEQLLALLSRAPGGLGEASGRLTARGPESAAPIRPGAVTTVIDRFSTASGGLVGFQER
jgi:acylphosphatase